MKRRRYGLGIILILLVFAVTGCGKKEESVEEGITKGHWTGLLGDKFGYNESALQEDFYDDVDSSNEDYKEIQACAEWEILTENGSFHPEEKTNWRYAIETSVRAIGLEKLNAADVGEVTENNLVDFFNYQIADIDGVSLDEELTEEEALLILSYAYDYAAGLTLPQKMECTFTENVKEAEADSIVLKGDGETAIISDGSVYESGDVIYVQPTDSSSAYAVKVSEVEGNEISYTPAAMEDVFEELKVSGTYSPTVLYVVPAEGITVSKADTSQEFDYKQYMAQAGEEAVVLTDMEKEAAENWREGSTLTMDVTVNSGSVSFHGQLQGIDLTVTVSDIKATPDVDFGLLKGLEKANFSLTFWDEAKAEYAKEEFMSSQISLGEIVMPLGTTPLSVNFSLVANLGVDGKISVTYTSNVVAGVNYQKGKGLSRSLENQNPTFDFHADATVAVEPAIKVELCCLGLGLTNVKVISGIVAIANVDADLFGKQPLCVDVFLYVPLRIAINEDGCVMTSISDKLKYVMTIWDADSSPVQERFHWEDGQLVDACTRKEEVEAGIEDEEGELFDEYKYFEFKELVFGFIKVSSQTLIMKQGESMNIGFLSLPDGYTPADLVYTPEDSSVCSAGGGSVTATGSGSTTMEIATPDKMFSVYVTVLVDEEYHDVSGFRFF